MNRGELILLFEHAQNNWAAVHRAMHYYYADQCSLEDALMMAVVDLAAQNQELAKAAALAPPPIVITQSQFPPPS